MNRLLSTACLVAVSLLLASPIFADDAKVKLTRSDDTVAVTIGGQEFTTYHFAKTLPKPFLSPVKAADGAVLTRPIVGPDYKGDHPHHKGIWVSVDEVNDIKFWAEKGKIENRAAELLAAEGNPAKLKVENHWLGENGETLMVETTTILIFANRQLTFDIRFRMTGGDVNFKDTKEGLFGVRIAESMREDKGAGVVVNADGRKATKECWGQNSNWVDYTGPVDGKTYGVTIFDHPKNFRPSRYHVRGYGLFSVSPFGEAAYTNGANPQTNDVFKKDSELRLRYGIYFHDGDAEAGDSAGAYNKFLESAK